MYFYYYATQVVHCVGGKDWDDGKGGGWNPAIRDILIKTQNNLNGLDEGSWDPDQKKGHIGTTGRLATTSFCLLTLEVYYRYTPLD
jgi:hypothetical protein